LQVGDIPNRGPQVLESLLTLNAASRALRWNVVNLLGNHEVLLILGDETFVHSNEDGHTQYGRDRRQAFMPGGEVFKAHFER
jgi:hypothetical protein